MSMTNEEIQKYKWAWETLALGQTVRTPHLDCPAVHGCGADHKRRLDISRVDKNGQQCILFNCHHCGNGGKYIPPVSVGSLATEKTGCSHGVDGRTHQTDQNFSLSLSDYAIASHRIREWPVEARYWLSQYDIRIEDVELFGIAYSPKLRRVLLPVFTKDGLVSMQGRAVFANQQPRYLTCRIHPGELYFQREDKSEDIVIVEDYLSALKCSRVLCSTALFTTTMSDAHLNEIVSKYKRAFIWLDNDNAIVRANSVKLATRLSQFIEVREILTTKDPKCYSASEIREILYG